MGGHRGQLKSSVAVILDERTITVSAFAVAPTKRRVRRVVISLVFLLVLLTVGTCAAYQALLSNTERTNLKQAALLPAPDAFLTPGAVVKDGNRIVLAEFTGAARRGVTSPSTAPGPWLTFALWPQLLRASARLAGRSGRMSTRVWKRPEAGRESGRMPTRVWKRPGSWRGAACG